MSTVAGQHEGIPVPEPGWYTDPQGTGDRWWDGQQWTEHTKAAPAAVATAWPVPAPPTFGLSPVARNTPATVGLVQGRRGRSSPYFGRSHLPADRRSS